MTDQTSFGYGQEIPNDAGSDYAAIAFVVRQMMARMDTSKLVQVVAVHGGGVAVAGTVDVLPLVQQIDGNGYGTPHGTVYGIPWSRVQGGKSAVICDPVVGDVGYVNAMDRDISKVKAQTPGSTTTKGYLPSSRRRFDISDGIYGGGALNVAPNQYLIFTNGDEPGVRLVDASGNSIAMAAAGFTLTDATGNVISTSSSGIALTPKSGLPVTVNGSIIVTGNLQLGGNIESQAGGTYSGALRTSGNIVAGFGGVDQVGLQTHTHTQPNDSHGDVEGPTSAPTAGT